MSWQNKTGNDRRRTDGHAAQVSEPDAGKWQNFHCFYSLI